MDIDQVQLLENGKVIHTDTHNGTTGGKSQNNLYSIEVKSIKPGATYTLRATMHSGGGTDSNGTVSLQEMP